MLSVIRALSLAIDLELKVAEAYEKLSRMAVDETVKEDLTTLSREEKVHANLLRTGKHFVHSDPLLFANEKISEKDIGDHLKMIENFLKYVDDKILDLEDALRRMHDMESWFETVHIQTLLEVKDPFLRKLFEALSTGDRAHTRRLEKLIQALYTPR